MRSLQRIGVLLAAAAWLAAAPAHHVFALDDSAFAGKDSAFAGKDSASSPQSSLALPVTPANVPSTSTARPSAEGAKLVAQAAPKASPLDQAGRPVPLEVTPEREAAALSFVRQHHPELAGLLVHLKRGNSRQYEQAMRELFRTSERLAQFKERDSERYELELEIWKQESQIRLLVARMTMKPNDPAMQEKLRAMLLDRVDLRIKRQRFERDRLAARLERLESDIDSLESERGALADQSFKELLQSVSRMPGARVDTSVGGSTSPKPQGTNPAPTKVAPPVSVPPKTAPLKKVPSSDTPSPK